MYKINRDNILYNGHIYKIGDEISDAANLDYLIKSGVVELVNDKKAVKQKAAQVQPLPVENGA